MDLYPLDQELFSPTDPEKMNPDQQELYNCNREVCPQFGNMLGILELHTKKTEFVDAVSMQRNNLVHHSKAETIS